MNNKYYTIGLVKETKTDKSIKFQRSNNMYFKNNVPKEEAIKKYIKENQWLDEWEHEHVKEITEKNYQMTNDEKVNNRIYVANRNGKYQLANVPHKGWNLFGAGCILIIMLILMFG